VENGGFFYWPVHLRYYESLGLALIKKYGDSSHLHLLLLKGSVFELLFIQKIRASGVKCGNKIWEA